MLLLQDLHKRYAHTTIAVLYRVDMRTYNTYLHVYLNYHIIYLTLVSPIVVVFLQSGMQVLAGKVEFIKVERIAVYCRW